MISTNTNFRERLEKMKNGESTIDVREDYSNDTWKRYDNFDEPARIMFIVGASLAIATAVLTVISFFVLGIKNDTTLVPLQKLYKAVIWINFLILIPLLLGCIFATMFGSGKISRSLPWIILCWLGFVLLLPFPIIALINVNDNSPFMDRVSLLALFVNVPQLIFGIVLYFIASNIDYTTRSGNIMNMSWGTMLAVGILLLTFGIMFAVFTFIFRFTSGDDVNNAYFYTRYNGLIIFMMAVDLLVLYIFRMIYTKKKALGWTITGMIFCFITMAAGLLPLVLSREKLVELMGLVWTLSFIQLAGQIIVGVFNIKSIAYKFE